MNSFARTLRGNEKGSLTETKKPYSEDEAGSLRRGEKKRSRQTQRHTRTLPRAVACGSERATSDVCQVSTQDSFRMNGLKAAAELGQEGEELPQIDGTCDACEPDEPQPACLVCRTCNFAFCSVHGEKHQRSTRHALEPYGLGERVTPERPDAEGAQGGEMGGGGVRGAEGEMEEEEGDRPPPQEGGKNRETVTVERLRCTEHGQEGSLYCKNDEKIICVVCAVQGEHSSHEIITLREGYMWQKSKGGIDLLSSTQEMAERIKSKWNSPEMSTEELERYVNQQFDELHRLVRLEEKRTLHLVDLKEAFLTAQAAEKIAEIAVHTERLQEEMDSITQQLGALDQGEEPAPNPVPMVAEPRPRLWQVIAMSSLCFDQTWPAGDTLPPVSVDHLHIFVEELKSEAWSVGRAKLINAIASKIIFASIRRNL
ncbi:hypothetical protein GJAV_G00230720 [Gymnothorax javanicus]|nr:hypothetical protein GJAV_G00230720 [Gymnothorax javanicus]